MGLEGLDGIAVIADDILVYGSGDTIDEATQNHDNNLVQLLERARSRSLKLNKDKMVFKENQVSYIGHVLTPEGLKPDPRKVDDVLKMERPRNIEALQSFLGLLTYLGKFIPHLTDLTEPLRRIREGEVHDQWKEEQEAALAKIQQIITAFTLVRLFLVQIGKRIAKTFCIPRHVVNMTETKWNVSANR